MSLRFPYSRQAVTEADADVVRAALFSDRLTQGPRVAAFEMNLATRVKAKEAIACSNGTAALHLAYSALGLGPSRGLLTSPLTFLATANAARMLQAPVIFADVNPETGNLDPDAVRRLLRSTTVPIACIAPVHLAGRPCDMPALHSVAREFGVAIVEDACHALGAVYRDSDGVPYAVGSCTHSVSTVFSFHAIKHVAMGEGGAVCTRSATDAEAMRRLRSHGMIHAFSEMLDPPEPDAPWYYEMHELGFNYRLTDLQCALGTSQLRRLDESLLARRQLAAIYMNRLQDLPYAKLPVPVQDPDGHAWHLFPLAIDFAALGKSRGQVMRELAARGVGTQVHYIPVSNQPYYRALGAEPLRNATHYYERTLSIPLYPGLQFSEVEEICDHILAVLAP